MATAGEIDRAARFLEFAREVRLGKRKQRSASRRSQTSWTARPAARG